MSSKKRYLVTTALQKTWVNDRSVVFLGKWCLKNNKKDIWKKLDYKVVPYHWVDSFKMEKDLIYINKLYESILSESVDILNKYHGINWSNRAWRILIGPWVFSCTSILLDRWKSICSAKEQFEIEEASFDFPDWKKLTPFDHNEFGDYLVDDNWNYGIYSSILVYLKTIKLDRKKMDDSLGFNNENIKNKINFKKLFREIILYFPRLILNSKLYKNFSYLLSMRNENFIHLFYIKSRLKLIKLFLNLGDFPYLSLYKPYKEKKIIDLDKRKSLLFNDVNDDKFEKYLRKTLPNLFPYVYIEGFEDLLKSGKKNYYPSKIKKIITSVGIWKDEVFKAWTAEMIQKGAKLIITQHGGEYGTALFNFFENHEIKVCDKYLSWGWNGYNKKIIKSPCLLLVDKKKSKWRKDGPIIIVPTALQGYFTQLNPNHRAADKAEIYFNFIEDVITEVYNKYDNDLIIRIPPEDSEKGYSIVSSLENTFPNLLIDTQSNFNDLLNRCSLGIYIYDSTTFLQALGKNQPCILVDNKYIFSRRKNVKSFYDELNKVGIFQESPSDAGLFINEIHNNINNWWNNEEVVKVRRNFSNQFAYNPKNPIKQLSKIIMDI